MKSFAIKNIKKYKNRIIKQKVGVILYHIAEAITLFGVVAVGILLMGCYN